VAIDGNRPIAWSYGGGTQSIAIAVLVAQGKLPRPEVAVIADTGREATETWEYTDRWVRPLLRTVGLDIQTAPHSLAKVDLYGGEDDESLLIPAYTQTGALPTFCSTEWKTRVVSRYLRSLGYGPNRPVRQWIGISIDEMGRMKPSQTNWIENYHPLIWDAKLRREGCRLLVESAGLPTPPKSSCWMCPHRRNPQWRRLRDHYPQDFEKACRLDDSIRERDKQGGVWLHSDRVPLREADLSIEPEVPPLIRLMGEVDGCDSGMCWV
jgi:hypothetical protein